MPVRADLWRWQLPDPQEGKADCSVDKNMENWRKADHYLDMLKRAHTLAVKLIPEVLDFLRAKLAGLSSARAHGVR